MNECAWKTSDFHSKDRQEFKIQVSWAGSDICGNGAGSAVWKMQETVCPGQRALKECTSSRGRGGI